MARMLVFVKLSSEYRLWTLAAFWFNTLAA
jgi:hypothetical protein